jgi:hypothetical protein
MHSSPERGWLHFERLPCKHRPNVHQSQYRRATVCLGIVSDRDLSRVPFSDSLPAHPFLVLHANHSMLSTPDGSSDSKRRQWTFRKLGCPSGLDERRADELYCPIRRCQRWFQSTYNLHHRPQARCLRFSACQTSPRLPFPFA